MRRRAGTPGAFRELGLPWPLLVAALVAVAAWSTRRTPATAVGTESTAATAPGAAGERGGPRDGVAFGTPWVEDRVAEAAAEWLTLRMPVPAGVVVLCMQGNRSAEGRTHSFPQNLHALDLANRVLATVPIVAAAPGVVAYVFRDAGADPDGGSGYGNQVRVLHDGGLFTEYAHLERVEVEVGDAVRAGQRLGTMGRSGLAGDRHLHFSLHRGIIDGGGVPPTLEMAGLVTQEIGDDAGFVRRASGELRCSPEGKPWSGALYASENDGGEPVLGPAPPALAVLVDAAASELARSVHRRARLWDLSTAVPRTTPAAARVHFEPLLAEDDRDPVAHYAWAVEVDVPEGNLRAALAHLERAAALNEEPALFEPWLAAWIANQRGAIALRRRQPALAERQFALAAALLPRSAVLDFAERQRALLARRH